MPSRTPYERWIQKEERKRRLASHRGSLATLAWCLPLVTVVAVILAIGQLP